MKPRTATFLLFSTALLVRLAPLAWMSECFDIALYRYQAIPVLERINPYLYFTDPAFSNIPRPFVYLPLSMFYAPLFLYLSSSLGLPFHLLIRLPAIALDLGVLALLFFGIRDRRAAVAAGWMYALSPVAVLTASFQGNSMAGPVLLTLAALLAWDSKKSLSGLCLGTAIAWRTYPLFLAPLFLLSARSRREALAFAAWTAVPVLASALPLYIADPGAMREALKYGGMDGSVGWQVFWPDPGLRAGSTLFFCAGYAALVWMVVRRRLGLARAIPAAFFLFYFFSPSVSQQYLLWTLPFLALAAPRAAWGYSIAAGAVMALRYSALFPEILWGRFHDPSVPRAFWPAFQVPAVFLLWLLFGGVLAGLVRARRAPVQSAVSGKTAAVAHKILTALLALTVACEILFVVLLPRWDEWTIGRAIAVRTSMSARESKIGRKTPVPLPRVAPTAGGGFAWFDSGSRELIMLDAAGAETRRFVPKRPGTAEPLDLTDLETAGKDLLMADWTKNFAGRFDAQGNFLDRFFPPEILSVIQMDAAPDGRVAVLDPAGHAVWLLSAAGSVDKHIDFDPGPPPFSVESFDLSFDRAGNLFLLDGVRGEIRSLDGPAVRFPVKISHSCVRLETGAGAFFVAQIDSDKITQYGPDGGVVRILRNRPGERVRRLDLPAALCFDGEALWIADAWQSRLIRVLSDKMKDGGSTP